MAGGELTAARWARPTPRKRRPIGYDFIHSVVDDYSRVAYSEILPDERGTSCAAFFARALEQFHQAGIPHIDAVMTDNHWSYTRSKDLATILEAHRIEHILIRPHCPWQNGKVERFNRTLQNEWAYRQVFASNDEHATALAPWLDDYNTRRRHSALGGLPRSAACHQPDGRVHLERARVVLPGGQPGRSGVVVLLRQAGRTGVGVLIEVKF